VVAGPGSANVIGGTLLAMKTGGSVRVEELIVKDPLAMKCAFGENPRNVYGQSKKVMPVTRMGTVALFRETLFKARDYAAKKELGESDPTKKPEFNMKYEALLPVLNREIPIHAHAHRADDIFSAMRVAEEFNLRAVLIHCSEGHLIADYIKEAGYKAIIGPTMCHKSKPEVRNKTFDTPGVLAQKGVTIAITTDHPVIPLQHLPICAALAVQSGMDETEAMKSITINAAEIMGLCDRIGSLKEGKDADIVIWTKHPFDTTAQVLYTIINGKVVYKK
jgi:imidazolonepropionase-like amidohydrolase